MTRRKSAADVPPGRGSPALQALVSVFSGASTGDVNALCFDFLLESNKHIIRV